MSSHFIYHVPIERLMKALVPVLAAKLDVSVGDLESDIESKLSEQLNEEA